MFSAHCRQPLGGSWRSGAAGGELAESLSNAGFEIVAIDSNADSIVIARARGVDARIANWPDFPDTGFDAVLFTRSLHHVERLQDSVDAAIGALAPGGRLIVEDFMAEGSPERSQQWFRSFVTLLHRSGSLIRLTPFLEAAINGSHHHGHPGLHSSRDIAAALRAVAHDAGTSHAAYFFRYLIPTHPELAAIALRHELGLIAANIIEPLGRRYVVDPSH
ncbi:MAG: methyltransferase domain-containing protein [Sphingomonas sp.]